MHLKPIRRKWLFALTAIIAAGFLLHLYKYLDSILEPFEDLSDNSFPAHDQLVRETIHYENYKFSLAEQVKSDQMSWNDFENLSQEQKCFDFFSMLDAEWPEWEVSMLRDLKHNKLVVNKKKFFQESILSLKDDINFKELAFEAQLASLTTNEKQIINDKFNDQLKATTETERIMSDTMTIIRIFGHCFFENPSYRASPKLSAIYRRYSKKILPSISNRVALVQNDDVLSNYRDEYFGSSKVLENESVLSFYHDKSNGSGIVISCATHHSREMVRLIHALRAQDNKLPIQIFYRSDLLSLSKNAIQFAATVSKRNLLGLVFSDVSLLKDLLKEIDMTVDDLLRMPFPPQKVTLINLEKPLSKLGVNDLSQYNSKIAALFFSSFENVVLLDADTVPLVKPIDLLELKEYCDTGAYFFRDRSLVDQNQWIETNFFSKLMPHQTSVLDMAMGISPVTSKTMNNPYMRGWEHMQESGLLLYNRKRHFKTLIPLISLSLWEEPVRSSVWGDKELYWIAMAVSGTEDYTLHPMGAASVGIKVENQKMKHYIDSVSNELCSTHPGHVSTDGKLLWINSGFSYCKKNDYDFDLKTFPFYIFEQESDVARIYQTPLKLRHAIVPPDLPRLRSPSTDLTNELNLLEHVKNNRFDVDDLEVDQIFEAEPSKGWIRDRSCSHYMYCAYDMPQMFVGHGTNAGHLFTFSEEDAKQYDILGAIWLSAKRVIKLPQGFDLETEEHFEEHDYEPAIPNLKIDSSPLVIDDVQYDPSQVRERPEKLSIDFQLLLEKLLSDEKT